MVRLIISLALLPILLLGQEEIARVRTVYSSQRVINGHSAEVLHKNNLSFDIGHRFGFLNGGVSSLWGLDDYANIRLGLQYGITEKLSVGVGRSRLDKVYDGFVKYQLLRQSRGSNAMPLTATIFAGGFIKTADLPEIVAAYDIYAHKMSYTTQLILSRQFYKKINIQVSPTYIHRNLVAAEADPNSAFALGVGGEIKLTRTIYLSGEYYWQQEKIEDQFDSFAVGVNFNNIAHQFQLFFGNSLSMNEYAFIKENNRSFFQGDIRFGFNIVRIFQF